jgi:hypothetical protein
VTDAPEVEIILLGMAGLDTLDLDTELKPPDGEL